MLPDRCEDCKSFRCHDWMCELPVLQQTRGDVVAVSHRSDNIVGEKHPTEVGANSLSMGCIRINAKRKRARSAERDSTRCATETNKDRNFKA